MGASSLALHLTATCLPAWVSGSVGATLSEIPYIVAAAALIVSEVLLFRAVTPAARRLGGADRARAFAKRFDRILVALIAVIATGFLHFHTLVDLPLRQGRPAFLMLAVLLAIVVPIAAHAAWLGPRIERSLDAAGVNGTAAVALHRYASWLSGSMVAASLVVLALGVALGRHEFSFIHPGFTGCPD